MVAFLFPGPTEANYRGKLPGQITIEDSIAPLQFNAPDPGLYSKSVLVRYSPQLANPIELAGT
jgi:hypothetical protein